MRAALILLCCTGCSWGLEALRAKNAVDIEAAALSISRAVAKHSEPHKAALDIWERTQVMKKDHKLPPKEIAREEADVTFNAYAGLVEAREVKRRKIEEIPGKLMGAAAGVVKKLIPPWIVWVAGIWLFFTLGGGTLVVALWRKGKQARSGLRNMVKLANQPAVKQHFKGQTNGAVQREYRDMREKGKLG